MSAGLHRLVLVLAWLGLAFPATAQQYPNWLQVLYNHQSVNPAYTAIGENLGFFIMNRSQMTGQHPANYARQLSFHSPVFNQFNGAGLDLISDRTDSISHLTLFTNYSYEMLIDDDIRLRLGGTFGFARIDKTGEVERDLMGNFGFGAFVYSSNGFFSLSFPRLIKNNAAYVRPEERIQNENRLILFSTAAIFPVSEGVILKPQLFYAIPYGRASRMDLSFHLLLKEKTEFGVLFSPGRCVGLMARSSLTPELRMAVAGDLAIKNPSGKRLSHLDLSLTYDIDLYGREKRQVLHF